MKTWVLGLVALLVGGIAGVGIASTEFVGVVEYFEPVSRELTANSTKVVIQSKGPKIVVDGGPKFEFGSIAHEASAEHPFVIRNVGNEPLRLTFAHPSCGSCIEVDQEYRRADVAPGQSIELVVRYRARKPGATFDESAYFRTNDPLVGMLRLEIIGTITQAVRLLKPEMQLGSISASEEIPLETKLLGFRGPEVEIGDPQFSDPTIAEFFEVTTKPMTKEEAVKEDEFATCGKFVTVKIKPGLPLGVLSQVISLETRGQGDHKVEIRISGEVMGDITITGGEQFNNDLNVLMMGIVKQGASKRVTLYMLVKGPFRESVKLSVGEVDPPNALKATLGEPVAAGQQGRATMYPLHIEVLPDAPPMNRVGSVQGPAGQVVIESTHPTAKTIPIKVRFTVE